MAGLFNDFKNIILFSFRFYDKNPNSTLGYPGRFQGLNVGVLLLRLDRMRTNLQFQQYLTSDGIKELAYTYGFTNTSLGKYYLTRIYTKDFFSKIV